MTLPATLSMGLLAVVLLAGGAEAPVFAGTPQDAEPKAEMPDDAKLMHEQLVLLSRGRGDVSKLRIEFMHGGMAAHTSFHLDAGTLVSKAWDRPGATMIHREGRVSDERVADFLRRLVALEYWSFEGTRFTPDSPMFLFRFYHGDLQHIDFRCDESEILESRSRVAIRALFLDFVADTEMTDVRAE